MREAAARGGAMAREQLTKSRTLCVQNADHLRAEAALRLRGRALHVQKYVMRVHLLIMAMCAVATARIGGRGG